MSALSLRTGLGQARQGPQLPRHGELGLRDGGWSISAPSSLHPADRPATCPPSLQESPGHTQNPILSWLQVWSRLVSEDRAAGCVEGRAEGPPGRGGSSSSAGSLPSEEIQLRQETGISATSLLGPGKHLNHHRLPQDACPLQAAPKGSAGQGLPSHPGPAPSSSKPPHLPTAEITPTLNHRPASYGPVPRPGEVLSSLRPISPCSCAQPFPICHWLRTELKGSRQGGSKACWDSRLGTDLIFDLQQTPQPHCTDVETLRLREEFAPDHTARNGSPETQPWVYKTSGEGKAWWFMPVRREDHLRPGV